MALTLRTDDELDTALSDLASAEGASKQEIIRRAVLDRHERAGHRRSVAETTDRLVDQWSDVLDRLGKA